MKKVRQQLIKIFDLDLPILGICYGQQLICHLLGGKVGKANEREFGKAQINILDKKSKFYCCKVAKFG